MEENNEEVKEAELKQKTQESKHSGFGTAGMVLGIVAVCLSFLFFFEVIVEVCAVLALIFSIISLIKKASKGQAIAGLVLGIVAIVVIVNRHVLYRRTISTITTGITGITNSVTDSWNKVTDTFTDNLNKIQDTFSENANKVEESVSESVNNAQEAITEGINKAQEAINESINSIQDTFKVDENSNDRITIDKFNQIEEGMTYSQVAELIGSEGNLLSEISFEGISTKTYNWPASNGIASATIIFNNDKVSAKSQIGL